MQELNLCEILRGHEGETFYSPLVGDVTLFCIFNDNSACIECHIDSDINGTFSGISFYSDGRYIKDIGECMLFPSKDQRDWNKWIEEQELKVPKTWSDIEKQENRICSIFHGIGEAVDYKFTPIEESALALLKIHQLIEVGYGGNITDEEWRNIDIKKYYFIPNTEYSPDEGNNMWEIVYAQAYPNKHTFAFHTSEQAEEFLSYPENVKLLKDYFMI